ncbi:MAG: hypothetical protein HOK30_21295 [Rhodospirillaceae bacterium]|jgi:hypothetical protein|nr:hypothetical protein [Rhodospirillaceae bacterium]
MSNRDNDMTEARFATLLDAYGAEPDRWPASERGAGLAYLKGSDEARAAMEPAAALDGLLDIIAPDTQISGGLADRICALAPAESLSGRQPGNVIPFWRRVVPRGGNGWQKIAATAVLGIAAGVLFSEVRNYGARSPVAATAITTQATDTGDVPAIESAASQTYSLQSQSLRSDLAALSFTGFEAPLQGSPVTDSSGSDDAESLLSELPLL